MTEKLYYEYPYTFSGETNVTRCVSDKKNFRIYIDKSLFFPEGGGQPGDKGSIGGIEVLDTQEDGEDIYLVTREPLDTGAYNTFVNREYRMKNSVAHSGEHIFSGFVCRLFNCNNVGFHMGDEGITVDFDTVLSAEDIYKIEKLSNAKIRENIEIVCSFPDENTIQKTDFRFKKEIAGKLRLVEIPGCDICACCGTHVARTGEVGIVKCVSFESHRGGTRLLLKAGESALEHYSMCAGVLPKTASLFSAKPEEAFQAAEKYIAKTEELKLRYSSMKKELFRLKAEKIQPVNGVAVALEEELVQADIITFADILKACYGTGLVYSGNEKDGYKFVLCGDRADEIFVKMKAYGAVGGGRNGCIQGRIPTIVKENL